MRSLLSRRSVRATGLAAAAVFVLVACGAPAAEPAVAPPPALDLPATEVEVLTNWTEVDAQYGRSYYRMIRVEGNCFVESQNSHHANPTLSDTTCPEG